MTPPDTTDVLIIGGGLMGAAVAAMVRAGRPSARITIVDAGPPIADGSGHHLHETRDPEEWERYNGRVSSGIQGLYAADGELEERAAELSDLDPGMHRLTAFGHHADDFGAAALSWNVGGMSVHWTAATPWPEEAERFGDPGRWEHDLDTARRLLRVSDSPIGPSVPGGHVIDALRARFAEVSAPGREPQPMPMAVRETGSRLVRTGPAVVFPPIERDDDPLFSLVTGMIATELRHQDGSVGGVRLRELTTGRTSEIAARITVVCADALRTPQLLFASGVRPAALGAYLNEHAFISNRVLLDLERFGLALDDLPGYRDGETVSDSLWLPANSPAQPAHAQIMCRTYVDADGTPLAFGVGVSVYVPTDVRGENRVVFQDEKDITGMPRMRVRFSYSDADRARIEAGRDLVEKVAAELGEWSRETDSQLLEPGASLHFTGTVRAGDADDGTSVCDHSGRVWGFDNLYVAGNGVVPTALACNSTLTGVVTAVRAAEAVIAQLASAELDKEGVLS